MSDTQIGFVILALVWLITAWAIYAELRIKKLETKVINAEFERDKAKSQLEIEHLPDDALRSELNADLGVTPGDPKRDQSKT